MTKRAIHVRPIVEKISIAATKMSLVVVAAYQISGVFSHTVRDLIAHWGVTGVVRCD